jgi:hypothetical protein
MMTTFNIVAHPTMIINIIAQASALPRAPLAKVMIQPKLNDRITVHILRNCMNWMLKQNVIYILQKLAATSKIQPRQYI